MKEIKNLAPQDLNKGPYYADDRIVEKINEIVEWINKQDKEICVCPPCSIHGD